MKASKINNVKEVNNNLLTQQELRVNFTVTEAVIPPQPKVFEVGVIAKSVDTTEILTYITSVEQLDALVSPAELTSLQNAWTGKSYWLQTYDSTITQAMVDALAVNVTTIFFTATASGIMGDIPVNFDGIKFYSLKTATPWTDENLKGLVLKKDIGAFADPEDDGKSLYALLSFLVNYPVCTMQTTITHDSFTSAFINKGQRDALVNGGFSFWMQAKETTFLWDIYVAGRQGQGAYSYFILKYEVGDVVSTFIATGYNYTDESLFSLKAQVSNRLGNLKNKGVIAGYTVSFVDVAGQNVTDRTKGIVKGFTVNFNEQYRIAEVTVQITGSTGV